MSLRSVVLPILCRVATSAPVVWSVGGAVVSFGHAPAAAYLAFSVVALVKLFEAILDRSFGLPEGFYALADATATVAAFVGAVRSGDPYAYIMSLSFLLGAVAMGINAYNVNRKRTPHLVIDRPDFHNAGGNALMLVFQRVHTPIAFFVMAFFRAIAEDSPRLLACLPDYVRLWLKPSQFNALGWFAAALVNLNAGHSQFALATFLWGLGYLLDINYGGKTTRAFVAAYFRRRATDAA